jgi:hypothetical protein
MDTLVERLRKGKEETAKRCTDVAEKYTPTGVKVEYRKSLTGRAYGSQNRMAAPRPITRKALYIFLHECAHFHLSHCSKKSRHVEEFEAEQWAHEMMRQEGIRIPRSMTRRAKKYVAFKIEQALKRGAKKIDKKAAKWSGSIELVEIYGATLV